MANKAAIKDLLLAAVGDSDIPDSKVWGDLNQFVHDDVVSVGKSEEALSHVVMQKAKVHQIVDLSEEGHVVLAHGSPEARFFEALPPLGSEPVRVTELNFGGVPIDLNKAQSQAFTYKWITVKKVGAGKEAVQFLARAVEFIEDKGRLDLAAFVVDGAPLNPTNDYLLKKRKWLTNRSITAFSISKGPKFGAAKVEMLADLTVEHLRSKEWEGKEFKINFEALGRPTSGGHEHPLLKVRQEFRKIFLELGYEEMPTNRWVESSFWNFDSLFQPQQHPARDAHDTFFLAEPQYCVSLPEQDYVDRVKKMHEEGGEGSIGWRYKFSDEEMRKNILRTHTTAVSSRMLYRLAQVKPFKPMKYFSIDKVFRNETTDSTHLAEFYQIEGFVADHNITLTNLMGAIKEFFARIGIHELRFKPAYNPYTEPSMEIFGRHPQKGTWMEIGNSGIFRPEMLLPMGLPSDVSVAAWGLSLERPTMIMYGYQKIAELVGPKVDLRTIYANPIPRFEK